MRENSTILCVQFGSKFSKQDDDFGGSGIVVQDLKFKGKLRGGNGNSFGNLIIFNFWGVKYTSIPRLPTMGFGFPLLEL